MTILPKAKKSHKSDRDNRCDRRANPQGTYGGQQTAQGIGHSTSDRSPRHCTNPHLIQAPSAQGPSGLSKGYSKHLPKVGREHGFSKRAHDRQAEETRKDDEKANSDDEYGSGFKDEDLEVAFVERMKAVRGFNVKVVKGDGACMFRSVADQVYGDEEMHHDVRRLCIDYISKNRDHFSQFITEDFNDYLTRKRLADVHGNHVELQAMSEIFLRPIQIYEYHTDPINTFHPISPEANNGNENPPIRLSYHGGVHYNSIVDPFAPTIGIGLGLPGYAPGLADRNLMTEAKSVSERQHIEETMLKDKMRMTDWEMTEHELQRQIAKESYMEYVQKFERHKTKSGSKSPRTRDCQSTRSSQIPVEDSKIIFAPQKRMGMAVKRGASSPNLPSSSHSDYHRPKMYRNECTSSSMPNIDVNFGSSIVGRTTLSSCDEPADQEKDSKADKVEAGPSNAPDESIASISLYEELLASTAVYDWNDDETAMLAQAYALSQQEFFDSLKNTPK